MNTKKKTADVPQKGAAPAATLDDIGAKLDQVLAALERLTAIRVNGGFC